MPMAANARGEPPAARRLHNSLFWIRSGGYTILSSGSDLGRKEVKEAEGVGEDRRRGGSASLSEIGRAHV